MRAASVASDSFGGRHVRPGGFQRATPTGTAFVPAGPTSSAGRGGHRAGPGLVAARCSAPGAYCGHAAAEELLLLGLDPVAGTVVNSARRELLVGLAGALVGELALAGLVDLAGERFVAVGTPPDDPLLAAAHQALAQSKGRRAADQLRRRDKGIAQCLVSAGRRACRPGSAGPSPGPRLTVHRHPASGSATGRARGAAGAGEGRAAGDGELERTAVVLALTGPSQLLEVVAPDQASGPHAKRRIETATELTPVTRREEGDR